MEIGVHPHGEHQCQCVEDGYITTVGVGIKCNTLRCPICGSRLRAVETGEYRGIGRREE